MRVLFLRGDDVTELKELNDRIVIAMPYIDGDKARRSVDLMVRRSGVEACFVALCDEKREGFVALINRTFAATQSELFGYVAEDAFAGRYWLSQAVGALDASGKSLLAFNDGKWMGKLASFGLSRRLWATQNYGGNLFFDGYSRHYADAELTVLALSDQCYCYNPNSVLLEVDWEKDDKPIDPTDRDLYRRRAVERFGDRVQNKTLLDLFR